MKKRLLLTLVVVVLLVSAVGTVVQASHDTPETMANCASHGLGPNFHYAEGPESALIHCLEKAHEGS